MKITIIGANSYIARNLIQYIKENGLLIEMSLYDRLDKQIDGAEPYKSINILDEECLHIIDLSCDVIFMFVGMTGTTSGFDNYKSFVEVNELSLLNLLNEYRRQNSKARIVFPSTRLVYKGNEMPLKEDADKETKSIYACNKLACEKYLILYNTIFDVRYCILRICLPYGTLIEGTSSYGTIELFVERASKGGAIVIYGQGQQRRTLTWIGDLCNVLLLVGTNTSCENDVFNVGGEEYSILEIAEIISKKYRTNIKFKLWPMIAEKMESGNTVFNSVKLEAIIGNHTIHRFEDWIEKLVAVPV